MGTNCRTCHLGEKGFSTAWILGLVFMLLLIGMVFFEFGTVIVDHQNFTTAADRASNAGATAIDENVLISSDGLTVKLDTGPDPDFNAVERCRRVIDNEVSKNSKIDARPASYCQIDLVNDPSGKTIVAHIEGTVDLGFIGTILAVSSKTFTVESRALPSCSDSSTSSGAC